MTVRDDDKRLLRNAALITVLVAGIALLLALLMLAGKVFLLLFAGVLLALVLRVPTDWLKRHTPMSEQAALGAAVLGLIAILASLGVLLAMPIGEQLVQLSRSLPRALSQLREWLEQHELGRMLTRVGDDAQRGHVEMGQVVGHTTDLLSALLSSLLGLIVVLFLGVYLAAQPLLYQRGLIRLVPPSWRSKTWEVFDRTGVTLQRWLLGRLITMTIVGVAAALGLWLLDVPTAFALGLLAGLLEFMPYIGPAVSALPPILIAFNADPLLALYVALLFAAIQSAENYLVSPLIEQQTVFLPPALVIVSTLLLGTLFGVLGALLASPLVATVLVVVDTLYVQPVLQGDKPHRRGVPTIFHA